MNKQLCVITPYIRVIGTQQATSDIWNIHKPNESYMNVRWDKPEWKPSYVVPISMNQWARLGNQMFQYAISLKVALQHKKLIGISTDKLNLQLFKCFTNLWYKPITSNIDFSHTIKEQKEFSLVEIPTEKIDGNISCDGYFQNFNYFNDIESTLQLIFQFHESVEVSSKLFLSNEYTKVAVHLRITDQPFDKRDDFVYTIWEESNLIEQMKSMNNEQVKFYMFSNDIKRCKLEYQHMCNMFQNQLVWVDKNEYESLCIMSKCDHFIISASTFSWWGAWLKWSKDKKHTKVIIPKQWFNPSLERVKNNDVSGLYFDEWKQK